MKGAPYLRAICVACAWLWAGGSAPSASAAPEVASWSDQFVDSIGVNVHATHFLGFATTTYDNWDGVVNAVGTLGIRNVRDHLFDPTRMNQLTAATGAKVCGILENFHVVNNVLILDPDSVSTQISLAKQVSGLVAVEGPGEYDGYSDPNWAANLTQYQTLLYNAAKADSAVAPLPMLAPSLGNPGAMPGLGAYADRGNIHSYPSSGVPTIGLSNWLASAAQMVGPKAVWATETGYHEPLAPRTPPYPFDFSRAASAKYMPRLLMEYANAGIEKTFLYELADDNVDPNNLNAENNLGLTDTNFNLKPAGLALKNLIALLGDAGGNFSARSLDYTLSGGNANLHHRLMQKADGTFYLALWQDVSVYDTTTHADISNPDLPITLTLNTPIQGGATYLPDGSVNPTSTFGSVSQLNLSVPDQVMLVQLTPTPEPAELLVLSACSFILCRRNRARRRSPVR